MFFSLTTQECSRENIKITIDIFMLRSAELSLNNMLLGGKESYLPGRYNLSTESSLFHFTGL